MSKLRCQVKSVWESETWCKASHQPAFLKLRGVCGGSSAYLVKAAQRPPRRKGCPRPWPGGVPHLLIAQACRPLGNLRSLSPAVVDHYTSKIVFNGVRVIAIIIIGLGFLLLLLPEEWDVWLIKLLTRLKVRKKEEAAEGGADLGLGLQSKNRRARPSFAR